MSSGDAADRGVRSLLSCTGVAERKAKLVKKSLNAGQQNRTVRGQVASRATSLEQLGAQAPFERVERLRHTRLREIDDPGRAAHAFGRGDCYENAELANRRNVIRRHGRVGLCKAWRGPYSKNLWLRARFRLAFLLCPWQAGEVVLCGIKSASGKQSAAQ